jgi:hypothetical protein
MPNGFPTRPLREAFGPEPENQYPVRHPAKEFDGETTGRLMFHQLSGLGQVNDLSEVLFDSAGNVSYRSECWNPKRLTGAPYLPPVVTALGVGHYSIQYAVEYPDHTGTLQPVVFRGGYVNVHGDAAGVYSTRVLPEAPYSARVEVWVYKWSGAAWVATAATQLVVLR